MVNQQMVSDQERSEKCLQIAQKHLLEDDHQTALHYLYISQQLCPSNYVEDMINKVEQLITVSEENGRYETERQARESKEGDKSSKLSELASELHPANRLEFTQEQLKAVEKIKACTNYYQILNVRKGVDQDELKKQYRKLALQYHPDKNRAPGASEAFKKINSAFDTLRDPLRRQHYDLFGNTTPLLKKNSFSEDFHNNFGDEFPNEMFYNVFCENYNSDDMYTDYGNFWCDEDSSRLGRSESDCQRPSGTTIAFQILPVILFVFLSILSSYLMSDPVYSLSRDSKYKFPRQTADLHIPYFVKANFERYHRHTLKDIEEEINQDFVQTLTLKCFRERNYKENLIRKAKNVGDKNFESQATNLKTPSCSELQEIQKRIGDT